MFNKILSLLSAEATPAVDQSDRTQVAVAVLLLEMAHADKSFEPLEDQLIRRQLQERFSLGPEAAAELIAIADEARRESVDIHQFTRLINNHFSNPEKLEVMEALWRVVYSDGELDHYEDALARQLSGLLRLSPKDAIALKLKVLDELFPERRTS